MVEYAILDLLVVQKIIHPTVAKITVDFAKRWQMSGFHALLATHILSESEMADSLAKVLKIDRVWQVKSFELDDNDMKLLSFRRAREWEVLPLGTSQSRPGKFEVVVADPTRKDLIDNLSGIIGQELTLAVSERSDIVSAIDLLYPLDEQLPGLYRPVDQ